MNCLVWNYHGLGNLCTGRELGKIIQAKDLSIMFMVETWTDVARLDQVMKNINFDNKWVVPKEGYGGGLAPFWKSSINLVIEDSSSYFIDTWIDKNKEHEWRFTSFYGELATSRRCEAGMSYEHLIITPMSLGCV